MPAESDSKREAPISYRPPKELRAEFERRVNASGLSTSAFITKSVFGADPPRQSRRPSIDQLQAVATASGQGGASGVTFEEAVRSLTEIRAACFQALGRKP